MTKWIRDFSNKKGKSKDRRTVRTSWMHRPYKGMASARILARSVSATYSAENAIERSASETLICCLESNSEIHKCSKLWNQDRRLEGWKKKGEKGCASDSSKLCAININMAYDCSEFDGIYEQIIIVQRRTKSPKKTSQNRKRTQREPGNENRSRRRWRTAAAGGGRWPWLSGVAYI